MEESLVSALVNPARPVFLFGLTPPSIDTTESKSLEICEKFVARGRTLAVDGFICYDVQDETSRTDAPRPFRFRKLQDPSWYAGCITAASHKQCVVYKAAPACESGPAFEKWLSECTERDGHTAINVVGAPSSAVSSTGPSTKEACELVDRRAGVKFGCVCIAERHMKSRKEHLNLANKAAWGAEWFITQGIYDPEPMINVLQDYSALCKQQNTTPKKIVLTFTPCGRRKTMDFIKWLGMHVPDSVEERIFADETKACAASCTLMEDNLKRILAETAGCGVPLGINVESVSGFKNEIDATHDLFRSLQAILLDATGSPWVMRYTRLPWSLRRRQIALGGGNALMAEPAATPAADGIGAVLAQLSLQKQQDGLAAEGVGTVGALRMLSKSDTKELGWVIGDRNRLAAWQRGQGGKEQVAAKLAKLQELTAELQAALSVQAELAIETADV